MVASLGVATGRRTPTHRHGLARAGSVAEMTESTDGVHILRYPLNGSWFARPQFKMKDGNYM